MQWAGWFKDTRSDYVHGIGQVCAPAVMYAPAVDALL